MEGTLFISYSRADMDPTDWLKRLKKYLAPLRRREIVDIWDDGKIMAGKEWRKEIDEAIHRASAAVFIVGPGFLASNFVMKYELPTLLDAARNRGTKIFPLVVGYCAYTHSELEPYQSFNDPNQPLECLPLHEQNRILNEFCIAVDEVIRKFKEKHDGNKSKQKINFQKASQEIVKNLRDTGTAFKAQCRRRDDLVYKIEKRLGIQSHLEYEKFFFLYYHEMNKEEMFEFDQIRAITEGPLYNGNRRILEIIDENPLLIDEIPSLIDLRQHLVFWLNKYDKIFSKNHAMCVLYTGVEDGVPFPTFIERELNDLFRR